MAPNEIKLYITITEKFMAEAGYAVRDSWKGWDNENLDDLHAHNALDGPRMLSIDAIPDDNLAKASHESSYTLPGYKHLSYNNYKIELPETYFSTRINVLIHELVHFLQQISEGDPSYIKSTGKNYPEYISQRCETESHFIQLIFLSRHEPHLVPEECQAEFQQKMEQAMKDPTLRISTIAWASEKDII
ncbi:hypothetical protein SAMN06265348_10630 [Pedobacter westerhofensis]|uniref:Uncharacterized protein n=1 Tax=Pedobacter westerhofensis TaxID=425512 RepID=A0A521DNN5_9SPHI|nr:hypothetical protein [Pedobacter westerhofensis]SMO73212.1 hypothetical protein SAMN06265348_10630 [Pedobacter westerhofensis]